MIEHRNIHRPLVRLELKSELFLHSFQKCWSSGIGLEGRTRRQRTIEMGHKVDVEIKGSGESRLIQYGTIHAGLADTRQ